MKLHSHENGWRVMRVANQHPFGGSRARCGAPYINYGELGLDGNSARVAFSAKIVIMEVIICDRGDIATLLLLYVSIFFLSSTHITTTLDCTKPFDRSHRPPPLCHPTTRFEGGTTVA